MDLVKCDVRRGDRLVVGPLEYLRWGIEQGKPAMWLENRLVRLAGQVGVVDGVKPVLEDGCAVILLRFGLVLSRTEWYVPDWMLQHDFRWGEEIEVNGLQWHRNNFRAYIWGENSPIKVEGAAYQHARPIRPKSKPKNELPTPPAQDKIRRAKCPKCGSRVVWGPIIQQPDEWRGDPIVWCTDMGHWAGHLRECVIEPKPAEPKNELLEAAEEVLQLMRPCMEPVLQRLQAAVEARKGGAR